LNCPVITLDGAGAVGKTTIGQLLARRLQWRLLDSGALYRGVALQALTSEVDSDDVTALVALAEQLNIEFLPVSAGNEMQRTWLAGNDVSDLLGSEEIALKASVIAALPKVRQALLERQRAFLRPPGLIALGRDMGTVIFPEAPLKVFLVASIEVRRVRRHKQLKDKAASAIVDDPFKTLAQRDQQDAGRKIAPLQPADDAMVIETTQATPEEIVWKILREARNRHLVTIE